MSLLDWWSCLLQMALLPLWIPLLTVESLLLGKMSLGSIMGWICLLACPSNLQVLFKLLVQELLKASMSIRNVGCFEENIIFSLARAMEIGSWGQHISNGTLCFFCQIVVYHSCGSELVRMCSRSLFNTIIAEQWQIKWFSLCYLLLLLTLHATSFC